MIKFDPGYKKVTLISILPDMTIMKMEKIFSLSVSEATLPKPTLVMQVMV